MNVLLTGSTGFVGEHLVAKHRVFKHIVRTSDAHFFSNVYVVESINTITNWTNAFEGGDVIIHLAGLAHSAHYSTQYFRDVNVGGTLRLANEARKAGVKRFVFVSSIGVNGTSSQSEPFSIECLPAPHNDYARSKYEAELGLKKIAEETGLEVVIVRPTLVYGPNAPGNFGMLTKLVKKLPALPFGLANNRRDFIAVQNLADLLVTCATHPDAAGHTFLASDGETVSIKEFTNAMAKGLGKRVVQLPIPVGLMRLVGKVTGKSAMIEQLFGNLEVDSSNIQQVLGWTPSFTMEQAMATLKDSDK